MTKLIRFLSLVLLLSGVRVSAQTQVAALRDFEQVWNSNRGNPRGYYFEDQHHDLDKFVGEWEGMGFGNHLWRVHIIVLKKANYYSCYWSDALGLELSITKNGKACVTPTGSLLPGTSFIKGWGLFWDTEKSSLQLDVYRVPFIYGKADKPYQGLATLYLCLNAAHDTIVVRRSHLVGIDRPVIIPDYLSVPYDTEVCTLRRVKK
ncbi:hypothetical protein [Porphyromonas somerae]|uniref:Uncharacterized protein n=1 Tax=Porphyromonas somerae TaxID=322095 RepID=A0A134B5V7_9PORP|nr:hypothetical protein [Porphyromonas somerae]KXB73893.1 hypothetical protein HMPREF3184_01432 [Porphyromonadaceae bacterium KA00676]KXB75321.1 hypothetical protein HMPREF3185_01432 [Porphyromonas somerae]